jgi:hypothetical protein
MQILFWRYGPDDAEILPDDFTTAQMLAQMQAEFTEYDPALNLACIESERIGEWDFFLCELPERADMAEYLQTGYDEFGIAGFFETNPELFADIKARMALDLP